MLFLAGLAAYNWATRTFRDASARADAAEREAHATRREANQQIATLERSAQQASSEALSMAARAERTIHVLPRPRASAMTALRAIQYRGSKCATPTAPASVANDTPRFLMSTTVLIA